MIPTTMNAIWVGGGAMPDKEVECIRRSKAVLQGYTFKMWGDEELAEVSLSLPALAPFIQYARENRRWAFLSDMLKAYILATEGGWVMDADNEFIQKPDAFLRHHWVSGFESWNGLLHPVTAIMASTPGHPFSRVLLSVYMNNPPEAICSRPNTAWISEIFVQHGAIKNDARQFIESLDVQIYPHEVFCATEVTPETVAFHHFSASWK